MFSNLFRLGDFWAHVTGLLFMLAGLDVDGKNLTGMLTFGIMSLLVVGVMAMKVYLRDWKL